MAESNKAHFTRPYTGPVRRGRISSERGVTETGSRAEFYTLTKARNKQGAAEE
jgi:hypothetical protein